MAASMWDPSVRATIPRAGREARTPDAKARLGQDERQRDARAPERQLSHGLGELTVKSKNLPLRYTPIKQLVIYVLPFPKGAPTAPELIARCHGAVLEDERMAMDRMFEKLARGQAGRPRCRSIRRSASSRYNDVRRADGQAHRASLPAVRHLMIRQSGREVSRIEGFSDAVFGFALTLLVVSLEVPGSSTA